VSGGPLPIAVSGGEPAGIGVEIALKARAAMDGALPFFVIADLGHVEAAARGGPVAPVRIALPDDAAAAMAHGLPVLHLPFPGPATPGRPQPAQAGAVVEAIARAVAEVQAGRAAALCTLPIHKAALKSGAGFAFPGHTEYLAHLAGGGAHPVMMLAAEALDPPLRVVPATVHVPLSAVPGLVSPALIEETIRITHAGLVRDFGIPRPRIAVAGLNPHAGESGSMGHEDAAIIAPVVARLAAEGLAVTGPHPADTLFHPAARACHDAVVAMYHDQALIPLKTLDFAGGVNVTLGLPLVRTSPDHGTALDIAGRGVADASSLVAALRLAARMAAARGVAR